MDFGPRSNQHEPKDPTGMGADKQLTRLPKPVMDTILEGKKMIKSSGVSHCHDSDAVEVRQRDARPNIISRHTTDNTHKKKSTIILPFDLAALY